MSGPKFQKKQVLKVLVKTSIYRRLDQRQSPSRTFNNRRSQASVSQVFRPALAFSALQTLHVEIAHAVCIASPQTYFS